VAGRDHLVCPTNCLNLRSVRCSGGQQGTPICRKKSSSVGVGIIEASILPLPASLADWEAGIPARSFRSGAMNHVRPPATSLSLGHAPPPGVVSGLLCTHIVLSLIRWLTTRRQAG
jgi:hypothetical protein